MRNTQRPFSVGLLLSTHRLSHHIEHWRAHEFTVSIERDGYTYCLCEDCTVEMSAIVCQWERDLESALEALRRAQERFLGFDVYEEWRQRTA